MVSRGGCLCCAAVALGLMASPGAALAESVFDSGVVAYGRGDFTSALEYWEKALAAGDFDAARNLGTLYRKGQGVPVNPFKAAEYYRLAVDHGVTAAELNLAELYLAGQGVPQNTAKAKELLADAARHGSLPARFRLNEISEAEFQGQTPPSLTAPSSRGANATPPPSPQVAMAAPPAAPAAPTMPAAPPPAPPAQTAPAVPPPPDVKAEPVAVAPSPAVSVPSAEMASPPSPVAEPAASPVVAVPPPPPPKPPAPKLPRPPAPKPVKVEAAKVPVNKPVEPKPPEAVPEAVMEPAAEPAASTDDPAATVPAETPVRQSRAHVASYRNEADAARGWLTFNLPGLQADVESVDIPGKGHFIRLFAVGPSETVKQLCDNLKTRGEWCRLMK